MNVVVVDLGGTRLKAASLSESETVPSDALSLEHEGDWRTGLREVLSRFDEADELALCVPGIVAEGRVVALPGKLPGLEGSDLAAELGRPVTVVNDAIAYGVGEAVHGAGRGHLRAVTVTLGTGVGVAVTENGAPLGSGPLGGGLLGGQIPLAGRAGGPFDTSDRTGTFEARCRASSLLTSVPVAGDLPEAYELLRRQDPAAVRGFGRYRAWLTEGLSILALVHAPSVMVVGGGAAQPGLLDGVEAALRPQLWPGQEVEVRLAQLGDSAALTGLGVLSRGRLG